MKLRDLIIKKAYSSDIDDILSDFYIPALSASIRYDRIAGFFSSRSLAIASRGILGLIRNDGFMRLIVSPKLNRRDLQTILKAQANPEEYLSDHMLKELSNFENEFIKDHLFVLGWMIANNKLDMKVAVISQESNDGIEELDDIHETALFHQKIGILTDSKNDVVCFSGSINETAMAWLDNIEEFKVFRSWEQAERDYIDADVRKFTNFWNNQSHKVRVFDVPTAVKKRLIEIAPSDVNTIDLDKWYTKSKDEKISGIKLVDHQLEAINAWVSNGMMGIFEMATGTGKTYTALGCIQDISKKLKKYIVVVACPYQHLVQQWNREVKKYGLNVKIVIADSSNNSWKLQLINSLIDISMNDLESIFIITTHTTFSSDDFQKMIADNKYGTRAILIADEVHGLGAEKRRRSLPDIYDYRLGLSATPKRWFDDTGTDALYKYFGEVVYTFNLSQAINTINPVTQETYLTPYKYIPMFTNLNDSELGQYIEITNSIVRSAHKSKSEISNDLDILDLLRFKRAQIIKKAANKMVLLSDILSQCGEIKWMLIYCVSEQMQDVMNLLENRGIALKHRFTMNEGIKAEKKYDGLSERDFLLKKFAEGKYQVLVAMKCLDEGVDIPPARRAILMASSGNPREYIQRIGRVIRRFPQKTEAEIYDILVTPKFDNLPQELRKIEYNIFKKEVQRSEEIARIASNNVEALKTVYAIRDKFAGALR